MASLTWRGGSGDWSVASDWRTHTVPSAGDDVTINAPGPYTVTISAAQAVQNLTLNDSDALVNVTGALTVGGTLLDEAGTLVLPSGGVLQGGTVDPSGGGGIALNGGTLQGTTVTASGGASTLDSGLLNSVTWRGVLAPAGTIAVEGGLRLPGASGSGAGSLDLSNGTVNFLDSETLDNASVTYVGALTPAGTQLAVAGGATLTFGPNLVLRPNPDAFSTPVLGGPGTIVNMGTLLAPTLIGTGVSITAPFENDGSINVGAAVEVTGNFTNNGHINFASSDFPTKFTADQNLLGGGTITLAPPTFFGGGSVKVDGAILGAQNIVGPKTGAFTLAATSIDPGATIENFFSGSKIDLTGVPFVSGSTSASYVDGTLTITTGGTLEDFFQLHGAPDSATFTVASDGASGTAITTDNVPCFVSGTRIRTVRGEVAVEELRTGDLVPVVRAGGFLPIIWIGHRRVRIDRHPRPWDMYPVRVSAGAFADFVPERDLWLSPEHAVFLHGVLVPVRLLLNGTTIVQVPCAEVTYWHVELPSHDLLLCEGAWTESYLDMGNRAAFAEADAAGDGEGAAPVMLHPDFSRESWEARACQQQERGGPVVAAIRQAINARATARAEAA